MAIAHVCVKCGWDLARVRPQREPHYGLNLVRCPRCGAASVRRQHPIRAAWRKFRRFDFAMTLVFLRLVAVATLTLLCAAGSVFTIALASELKRTNGGPWPREAGLFLIIFYLITPTLLGAFLTAAFAHIARWKVWLGWLAWIAIVLIVVSFHGPLDSQFDPRVATPDSPAMLPRFVLDGVWFIVLPGMLACTAMLISALPGIVLGRLLLRLRDAILRSRWRWRYRKLRLAGAANV